MRRGKKPLSKATLALRGSKLAQHRSDEARFAAGRPECPSHLSEIAQVEWERICELLEEADTLAKTDRSVLARYCVAWARWTLAEEKLAETGGPILTSKADGLYMNPWGSVANRAFAQLQKCEAELGLSPASRARVKPAASEPAEANDGKPKLFRMG